jgi:maltose alpha-D-glucosyltransferase/alpha-amylase
MMHLGLLSDPWRVDVAPEPLQAEQLIHWEHAVLSELEVLVQSLQMTNRHSASTADTLIPLLFGSLDALRDQIHGFQALAKTYRTRIHGDFHLGQVLRRTDSRYVIVDFDGEPHRSLTARRQKYAPLRDVAGMLRSFAYARGTVERESGDVNRAGLRAWESGARSAFLSAYSEAVASAPVRLIPESVDDVRRALSALEIEKAIYECNYELNNRPDWLWLPLSRLVQSG